MPQPKKFNEFAKETLPLEGAKLRLDDVLNKEIFVIGFKVRTSKYQRPESSECLTLQLMLENNKYVLFSGSKILIDQIKKYQAEIPFLTTIKKIDKYYTFS